MNKNINMIHRAKDHIEIEDDGKNKKTKEFINLHGITIVLKDKHGHIKEKRKGKKDE